MAYSIDDNMKLYVSFVLFIFRRIRKIAKSEY